MLLSTVNVVLTLTVDTGRTIPFAERLCRNVQSRFRREGKGKEERGARWFVVKSWTLPRVEGNMLVRKGFGNVGSRVWRLLRLPIIGILRDNRSASVDIALAP